MKFFKIDFFKRIIVVLFALTLFFAVSCSKKNERKEGLTSEGEIFVPATAIMQVENEFVYMYEYNYFYSVKHGILPSDNEFDQSILEELKIYKGKAVLARKSGVMPTGEELSLVEDNAISFAEHLFHTKNTGDMPAENTDDFLLKYYGTGLEEFLKIYKEIHIGQYYFDEFVEKAKQPDESQIKEYYENNVNDYKSIQLIYAFFSNNNEQGEPLSEDEFSKKENFVTFEFSKINSSEEMSQFVAQYSELYGANENGGSYTYYFDGQSLDVFKTFCENEGLKGGDKSVIKAEDGIYAVFCEYINDLSSEEIKSEISDILSVENAANKLAEDIEKLEIKYLV